MKKSDLRIGLIGAAGRGGSLAKIAHRPGKGARIVACCDVAPEALHAAARTFAHGDKSPFLTRDYRELIDHARSAALDAVIIATPDYLHEEQAVAALERGLAVYLEKPMALTITGCDRILATAKRHRARLYLGHNMRHMGFVRKMKALIDEGTIGEVKACWCRHFVGHGGDFYFRDWHAERRYVNGLLLQKAAHDIDVIHWLCDGYTRLVNALGGLTLYGGLPDRAPATKGPRPGVAVKGMDFTTFPPTRQRGLNHRIDVEDLSTMQMRLSNGVYATYAQCHYTPDYWRSYTLIGTEGRLENFGNGGAGTHIRLWNKRSGYNAAGDATYKIPLARGTHGGADPLIIAEFLRYAREGGATDTSPLAARESVAAGCTATESLRKGGIPLKVPPPRAALARFFEPV
ncbi:oxidoreductase [Cephaloticoccus primus]|uniref:Oxidoreductase n=1 Tax=Cephaloticoccus primus TaxID=1548207 RepID=A0A139STB4_9BACT|nr:Gfo/Idh/MocA family oxidoreductase [Cephaloticoccus primus]KXU37722.1 oxidoreductase [Cephaloticoccus primus]